MNIILSAFADEASVSLAGQIRALRENAVHYIDVRSIDGENITVMDFAKCKICAKQFSEAEIRVNCLASPIGKTSLSQPFEPIEETMKRLLEKAHIFNTDKIRIFSFYESRGREEEVIERLNRLTEIAAAEDVKLYHENELGIYGEQASAVEYLLDKVSGLYNLFDWANFILVGQNIGDAADLLLPRSTFFHLKDATYRGEIVPAGEGDGEIEKSLRSLRKRTEIIITAEPHLTEFEGYKSIDRRNIRSIKKYASARAAFDAGIKASKAVISRSMGVSEF